MATHTFHPDTHEHGLSDGCERCAELAEHPLEMDPQNFALAWERMLRVQYPHLFPDDERVGYRSEVEAKLGSKLYEWSVFVERYAPVDNHVILREARRQAGAYAA